MSRQEVTISELIKDNIADLQTGPFGTVLKAAEYSETGVPLISVREIRNGFFEITPDTPRIDEKTTAKLPKYVLKHGDIVFGRKGGVERNARVNEAQDGWFLGSDGIRLRLSSTIDSKFISYQVRHPQIKSWLIQNSGGSTMLSLNQKILGRLPLVLPPLKTQQAIAHTLGTIDDKIDLNRRMNETLEAMAQAIFKSWFVDFDGCTEFEDSELGRVPKGWTVKTLADFGTIVCGKTPPKKKHQYYGGDIPFIKIPDMRGQIFVLKTGEMLSREGAEHQVKKQIPKGSICVSCIATVGQVAITTQDSHTNQQINSIVPFEEFYTPYLYLTAKGMEPHLKNLASGGSTTLNLNTGNFSKIKIIAPASEKLKIFHVTTEPIFKKISLNLNEIKLFSDLRDTLLPKLISGELQVDEAEKMVGKA